MDPEGTATERLAAKYGMSLERAATLHTEMTERRRPRGSSTASTSRRAATPSTRTG